LVDALSELGGLLAILQVSIIMNYLHRRCFRNEIKEERNQKKKAKE